MDEVVRAMDKVVEEAYNAFTYYMPEPNTPSPDFAQQRLYARYLKALKLYYECVNFAGNLEQ